MATVTVHECVSCEGRGNTPEAIWHVSTCADASETRPLTFEVPDGVSPPFMGGERGDPGS